MTPFKGWKGDLQILEKKVTVNHLAVGSIPYALDHPAPRMPFWRFWCTVFFGFPTKNVVLPVVIGVGGVDLKV